MISVNWTTQVIFIPQSYLTPLGGILYELDVDQFRLDLKDLEDDPDEGLIYPDTHQHNTEVSLGGVNFARQVQIINGYTVEFETGSYKVTLTGANNNIADVVVVTGFVLQVNNSAGLITTTSGGVQPADVWTVNLGGETAGDKLTGTRSDAQTIIDILCNNAVITNEDGTTPDPTDPPNFLENGSRTVTIYEDDGVTVKTQVNISADNLTRKRLV